MCIISMLLIPISVLILFLSILLYCLPNLEQKYIDMMRCENIYFIDTFLQKMFSESLHLSAFYSFSCIDFSREKKSKLSDSTLLNKNIFWFLCASMTANWMSLSYGQNNWHLRTSSWASSNTNQHFYHFWHFINHYWENSRQINQWWK